MRSSSCLSGCISPLSFLSEAKNLRGNAVARMTARAVFILRADRPGGRSLQFATIRFVGEGSPLPLFLNRNSREEQVPPLRVCESPSQRRISSARRFFALFADVQCTPLQCPRIPVGATIGRPHSNINETRLPSSSLSEAKELWQAVLVIASQFPPKNVDKGRIGG